MYHIIVLKASRPKPPGFLDRRPYIWRGGTIVRNSLLSDIIWQLISDPISEKENLHDLSRYYDSKIFT